MGTVADEAGAFVGAFGNRSGPRSQSGCRTCRQRKVKCDESRPVCRNCRRLGRVCDWTLLPRKRPLKPLTRRHERLETPGNNGANGAWYGHLDTMDSLNESLASGFDNGLEMSSESNTQLSPYSTNQLSRPDPLQRLFMPSNDTLPCGIVINSHDHRAIFLYRTWFASFVDTKRAEYSVPAILLRTAASAPAVMYMILATGRQLLVSESRRMHRNSREHFLRATDHYCKALRLFSRGMSCCDSALDLDNLLATIWLMAIYEQRFSDDSEQAVTAHLQGAIPVLGCIDIDRLTNIQPQNDHAPLSPKTGTQKAPALSYLGARLLVWLVGIDARAATFGLGGCLNSALAQSLGIQPNGHSGGTLRARILSIVHEASAPLFQATWGSDYPTTEIIFDIEHNSIFYFLRDCGQLRLSVANMAREQDTEIKSAKASSVEERLEVLRRQHLDLITLTSKMPDSNTQMSEALATTLCWVLSPYHAGVVDFLRVVDDSRRDGARMSASIAEILKLALYGFQKQGNVATVRVAWPLFIAGLETDDEVQQQWVIERLFELESFGKNYK